VSEADRLADELRGLRAGSLRVGASTTPGVYLVPAALGAFAGRFPGIELTLEIADTRAVEERLRARLVDCAVVGEYAAADDLAVAPLRPDDLVPICGPRHRFATSQAVRLDRFLTEPFIAREPGSSTRVVFEQWLEHRGKRLAPAMEFGATEAIKQAVAAGLGVTVVSDAAVALELESGLLHCPAVAGFPIRRRIDVALLKGRRVPAPAAAFLDVLMGARASARLVRAAEG
jgi:DNA-binding transcriptional LysR family regulator